MSKNKISERLFFLKFPNASLIETNGRHFYLPATDEAKIIYERVGDNYYKYKLSNDDELLPILTDNIPVLNRQISQQIQNVINSGELYNAKSKAKSYSYER
jgi:hypothetical protein